MNKTAIKNFAIDARNMLIQSAAQMAYEYEIEDGKELDENQSSIGDKALSPTEFSQRKQLVRRIGEYGFQNVIEEVAYTWFNRFTALRFMEVNGYLPSKVRVFTDEDGGFKPMIIKEALTVEIDGLDKEKVLRLIDKQDNEKLYKYLLITQCNALSSCLPEMFEKFGGWTELLFPANLLREGSVIDRMVTDIPEEDWKEQVQIIGWLYQYYNTEPKDNVFANLKKNVKISKENIPAATQLFTPDWIVRYMVENSLGRLWTEGHEDFDRSEWKYFLDEAEQEENVRAQLDSIKKEYSNISPEEIRFIDPCMGSGHILVYAFDVLMQIYVSQGWSERDAAVSIVEKNLYGLDIDKRAYQLAYFALMMKGRSYNRRFLRSEIKPNLCYFSDMGNVESENIGNAKLRQFAEQFRNADTYGSLLEVKPCDTREIEGLIAEMELTMFNEGYPEKLRQMVSAYQILSQKYDAVVTNPPYMGGSGMNAMLAEFVKSNYPDSKSDLFSVFMIKCMDFAKPNGFLGFLTPYVWMFIQSYEKLRNHIYSCRTIETLIQFEYSAFEEATVPICTFALRNRKIDKNGCYFRLTDFRGGMEVQREKTLEAIADHKCGFYYESNSANFSKIPGAPVAYWVGENVFNAFSFGTPLQKIADVKVGLQTGDNNRFLRYWYEICNNSISWDSTDGVNVKWAPHNKGGDYRKWYGNLEYTVNWENDGDMIKNFKGAYPRNTLFYFKSGFSWSDVSSGKFSIRFFDKGFIFDTCAPTIYPFEKNKYLLGLLNTKIGQVFMDIMSPTIHYTAGSMAKFPILEKNIDIDNIVQENIDISKTDWDSFETSWDFKKHPLV